MPENTEDAPQIFYYSCEHGSSNKPCICHILVDRTAVEQPDDWYKTYSVDADPGTTDSVSLD